TSPIHAISTRAAPLRPFPSLFIVFFMASRLPPVRTLFPSIETFIRGSSGCPAARPAPPACPARARYLYNPPPRYVYQTTMVNCMASKAGDDREHVVVHGKKHFVSGNGALHLSGMGISSIFDIKGLDALVDLKELDLSGNHITRIEGLDHLKSLKTLWLIGNQVQRIEGLDSLTELVDLRLSKNKILTIQGLETLKNLKNLELKDNQISEISSLDHLASLDALYLSDNHIHVIENLENNKRITALFLSDNEISEITGLTHLRDLQILGLSGNDIGAISNLDNNINLEHLTLLDNNISCIQGLEHASKLVTADFSRNRISSTKGLEHCRDLRELYLNHNHVRRLEGLDHLEHLSLLEVSNNQLENLNGIPPHIRVLNACHNNITNIDALGNEGYFIAIDVSFNRITRITPGIIRGIELLDVSHNALEEMDFVRELESCEGLNLANNNVSRLVLPACSRDELLMDYWNGYYPFFIQGNPLPASDMEALSKYLDGLPPPSGTSMASVFSWHDRKDGGK
nr:leucine-rich repeat domain-containing protein [Candidatus Sigynarchaeota archaeon]